MIDPKTTSPANIYVGLFVLVANTYRKEDHELVLDISAMGATARGLVLTVYRNNKLYGQPVYIAHPASLTAAFVSVEIPKMPTGSWSFHLKSDNAADATAVVVATLTAASTVVAPGEVTRHPLNVVERIYSGKCCLAIIGDSYVASGTTRSTVSKSFFAGGGRWIMRGVASPYDALHPLMTKQAAALAPLTFAPGAALGTSGLINRLMNNVNGWLFGVDHPNATSIGAFTPWDSLKQPYDLWTRRRDIDTVLNAGGQVSLRMGIHTMATSITDLVLQVYRTGLTDSGGVLFSTASTPSQYAKAFSRLVTAPLGGTGTMNMRIVLYDPNETGKELYPAAMGWVDTTATRGVVFAAELSGGGEGVDEYLYQPSESALGKYTDSQIRAWFEAHAAIEPIDTLMVHLGLNDSLDDLTTWKARYAQLIERWRSIGQEFTNNTFAVLPITPIPFISSTGDDRTAYCEERRDDIVAAVAELNNPAVIVLDAYQSMLDTYGPLADWAALYLAVEAPSGRLHFEGSAGAVAFGTAIDVAMEAAAANATPAAYRAGLDVAATKATVDDIATKTPLVRPDIDGAGRVATLADSTGPLIDLIRITPRVSGDDLYLDVEWLGDEVGAFGVSADQIVALLPDPVETFPGISNPVAYFAPVPVYSFLIDDKAAWADGAIEITCTVGNALAGTSAGVDGVTVDINRRVLLPPQPTAAAILTAVNDTSTKLAPGAMQLVAPASIALHPVNPRVLTVSAVCTGTGGQLQDPTDGTVTLVGMDPEGGDLPAIPATFTRLATGVYTANISLPIDHNVPQTLVLTATAELNGLDVTVKTPVNVTPRQPATISVTG